MTELVKVVVCKTIGITCVGSNPSLLILLLICICVLKLLNTFLVLKTKIFVKLFIPFFLLFLNKKKYFLKLK